MYIRPNAIVVAAYMLAASGSQAFDYYANLDMGMQTNRHQLVIDGNHNFQETMFGKGHRKDFANSFGYFAPEFINVSLYADFPVIDYVSVQPFMDIRFISLHADVGVAASYKASMYNDTLSLSTFLKGYRKFFYDSISFKDSMEFNLDYGARADVEYNPYVSVFFEVNQPFVSDHEFSYYSNDYEVLNRSNFAMGVSVHLLADFSELVRDSHASSQGSIIKEPISIPVIDLVIEEPEEPVIEIPSKYQAVEVVEEEPLGWFAWIIEFIASLFRF